MQINYLNQHLSVCTKRPHCTWDKSSPLLALRSQLVSGRPPELFPLVRSHNIIRDKQGNTARRESETATCFVLVSVSVLFAACLPIVLLLPVLFLFLFFMCVHFHSNRIFFAVAVSWNTKKKKQVQPNTVLPVVSKLKETWRERESATADWSNCKSCNALQTEIRKAGKNKQI